MRQPVLGTQFRRDVKLAQRGGKEMGRLRAVMQLLLEGAALPERCRDHALSGDWAQFRDCHIEPDWLLIYRIAGDAVEFVRTGRTRIRFERKGLCRV